MCLPNCAWSSQRCVSRPGRHTHRRAESAWVSPEPNSTKYITPTVKLASGKITFALNTWHHLTLTSKATSIEAAVDGAVVAKVNDASHKSGMASVGCDWNKAPFDEFDVC